MAGAVLERELTMSPKRGVRFTVATEADDPEIRRLLRASPMPGQISLSLEREPNFFAEPISPCEIKKTIVARDESSVICVGSCSIRQRYVNGKPRMVGYLGGLRLDRRFAGRFDILRGGYRYFHQLEKGGPADFYYTSIAADNHRARAFLERNLPGMPRYEFLCEFVTLMIPILLRSKTRPTPQNVECPDSPDEALGFLNERNTAFQFAPYWSAEDLLTLNQPRSSQRKEAPFSLLSNLHSPDSRPNFCILRSGQEIEACGALWDQRSFKQIVLRGYSKFLRIIRPVLNTFSTLANQPRLPAIGETLSIAFASHLASKTDAALVGLLQHLSNAARRRGIELLTLGFASNDPRLAVVRRKFRFREYHSRLYLVHWPGLGGTARELDNGVLAPEIALL